MKKITLSAMAVLALSGAAAATDTLTLYTDTATGQVYTTPAEGRVEMGDFVDAKTVYEENQAQDSVIAKKEVKAAKKGYVPVAAKASKLKFSGKHYLGYKYTSYDGSTLGQEDERGDSRFETRRNYFQVKAYLFDDKKSYMRTTLDTHQVENGDWAVRLKYAFLYLNEVLPYTGIEVGQVHRPWIDYEEHQGWWYRSIQKVYLESKNASDLSNSADIGFNLKTKLPYFTSEVGLFNGEGYHEEETGRGQSFEWRATAVITGNGQKKRKKTKDTYFDASFYGQYNIKSGKIGGDTYSIYGLHTVYNTPTFLIAAQYVQAANEENIPDGATYKKNGKGYSFNGEYRLGADHEYRVIGRYDQWTAQDATDVGPDYDIVNWIAGLTWQQNKNVEWIANVNSTEFKDGYNYKGAEHQDEMKYMITAEVNW